MLRRVAIYLKEMYPLLPRLFLGFLLYFEIYFLVVLTHGQEVRPIGVAEVAGSLTIFTFLLFLRIADDFKDYETDKRLFPDRPLPSGRVHKRDLVILISGLSVAMTVMNLVFIRNYVFFCILVGYGALMSVWFFKRYQIQRSLVLALVTHNPVQIVLTCYVVSSACLLYGIPLLTANNLLIAFTLYFPGLVWEISRKVWAPQDETEYVTYSKLFGVRKPVLFILGVMLVDALTTSALTYQLFPWGVLPTLGCYVWLVYTGLAFIRDPQRFKLVSRVELYEYVTETMMVAFIVIKLIM
jgi:4-hydroxybenzoate polyprenyltransferase